MINILEVLEANPKVSRRKFLKFLETFFLESVLPASERIKPEELFQLAPNPNLPAVGFSVVPDTMVHHHLTEPVIMTMNFGDLKIGGYGEGFKKARGEKTLVLEQYPKDKPLSLLEWKNYVERMIQEYSGIERVIIGNECNVPESHGSFMSPQNYASLYKTAFEAIKKISPVTKVCLYGEAYFDQTHNHLRQVLQILKNMGIRPDEGSTHFYDTPSKLKNWLAGYKQTLNKYFGTVPVNISEMGKPLSERITNTQHATFLVQDLALAAALIQQGEITFGAWFAGANFNKDQSHSIFRFSREIPGQLEPSYLFFPWLMVTRALHHQVKITETRGLTIVSGLTANEHQALVIWNKTNTPISFQLPAGFSCYNLYGQETPPTCFQTPIFVLK